MSPIAVNHAAFTCCYTAAILDRKRVVIFKQSDHCTRNLLNFATEPSIF